MPHSKHCLALQPTANLSGPSYNARSPAASTATFPCLILFVILSEGSESKNLLLKVFGGKSGRTRTPLERIYAVRDR